MTETKLNWRAPKPVPFGDEVGRSVLGQKIPRRLRGRISPTSYILAWLPLAISLLLGLGYAAAFPEVEMVWLRVTYLAVGGGAWSAWKLLRIHFVQVSDSMHREYMYARNELMPALNYAGALVSTSETLRLMKGEVINVAHGTNLYQANHIRLTKEPDGTATVQFLFG